MVPRSPTRSHSSLWPPRNYLIRWARLVQGSQYTSEVFTSCVLANGIKLSMDGKGRATDNAFIERLWRNVKYEEIYLNPPEDGLDLHLKLIEYFYFYNNQRRHEGIEYRRPNEVYDNTNSYQTPVIHEIDTYQQKKKEPTMEAKRKLYNRSSNLILLIYCLKKGEYFTVPFVL